MMPNPTTCLGAWSSCLVSSTTLPQPASQVQTVAMCVFLCAGRIDELLARGPQTVFMRDGLARPMGGCMYLLTLMG